MRLVKSFGFLCIFLGTLSGQILFGQQVFQSAVYRVTEIHFSGNSVFRAPELRSRMNLHTGRFSTLGRAAEFNKRVLQLDKINITTLYKEQGYINCSVQDSFVVTENRKVHLYIHVMEGEQYILNRLQFNGNYLLTDEELLNYFQELRVNRPFNPYAFRNAIDEIETVYENAGKPFRNIQSQLNIHGTAIDAIVSIKENQTVSIDSVKIQGLQQVKEQVVRREVTLNPGDRYSEEAIRESQRRIFETGLFADVTINPVPSSPDSQQVDLLVSVRNMDFRTIRFDLGARQYESTPGSEPYTALEVSAEWFHRNLMERARQLGFSAAGRMNVNDLTFLPNGEVRYTEPWLWKFRIPTTLRVFYDYNIHPRIQRSIYQWGSDITFLHSQRRRLIIRSILRFQETIIPKTLSGDTLRTRQPTRGQERSIGFLFRRDQRDNFLYPKQGYFIEVEPEFFIDIFGGTSDFYRIETTLSNYWNIFGQATLAGRIKVGSLHFYDGIHGYIPDYEKLYLGGPTSVRGFATDRLKYSTVIEDGSIRRVPEGDMVKLLANLELRFPIYWKFGGEIFLDAGQLWSDYSALNILSMRYTSGFGITFATPLGPARVDFGWKLGPLRPAEKPWIMHVALQYAF